MKTASIIVCNFASIPEEIASRYDIFALKSTPYWPEGENIPGGNIYEKMRNASQMGIKTFPKTSQPPMGTFKKAFEEGRREGRHVICITISSKISGTYNSAVQTKKLFSEEDQKRIHIIDSDSIDTAETLLGIKAAELSEKGEDPELIVKKIEALVPRTYFYGMTANPHQMEAGGRIGPVLAAILVQMQKIGLRPVLHMHEGTVKPAKLKMNAQDTAEALFKHFKDREGRYLEKGGRCRIGISHADNMPEAKKLEKLFAENYGEQARVEFISLTGIFIGSHVGPGTLMCGLMEEPNE